MDGLNLIPIYFDISSTIKCVSSSEKLGNLLYLSGIPQTKIASTEIINKVVQLVEDKVKEKNN